MKEEILEVFLNTQANYFKVMKQESMKDEPNKEIVSTAQTIIDTLDWAANVVKEIAKAQANTTEAAPEVADSEEKTKEKIKEKTAE